VKDSLAFTVDPHLAGNGSPVDMNGRTGQLGPLRYALEYGGRPGRAAATGVIAVVDSLWRVDAVQLTASGFDLQSVFPQAPASDITLSGGGKAQIVDGTLALVRGSLRMGPSTLADEPLDAVIAGEWTPGDVVVESLAVATSGLSLRGQGRLRAGAAPDDTVTLSLEVARLSDLTPLLRAMHNLVPALPDSGPSGSLALQAAITGSPAAPEASVELHAEDLRFGQVGAARIALSGAVDSTRRGVAAIAIDTLHVAGRTAERVGLDIAGGADSARVGITARRGAGRLAAALEVESPRSGRLIRIDSLLVGNSAETWRARPGGSIFVGGGAVRVDSLSLEGERGGIVVCGAVSRTDSTALVVGLRQVPLRGLALLAAVDTVDVTGTVSGSVRLEGPLATPSGVVTLATDSTRLHGAAVADVSLDLTLGPRGTEVAAALGQDSSVVLDGRVPLWIQGDPLRLAFQEEGALNLQVRVTRADLRRLHPFLVNVEDPTGELSADVRLGGTWREPDVSGTVTLRDGRLSVPALGVAYDRITLAAKFERSRAVIDSLLFVTGEGRMLVSGAVRLAPLHDPTLRLSASARGFEVMRDDQLLTLRADGELEVRGRLRAPVVHGEIEAPEAVLHFASLIDKSVVDLSDPVFAAVVDTSVLQRAALEPGLLREVRDSLVLDSVTVTLGSDVWLRSDDANIQLDGSATIGKRGDRYRVFGTFTARRGTYELALGPAISREFRIEGGTVRFFGDPRTDAEIDIEAEHTVRTFRGDRVGVTATIGGTVAEPEVSLSSSLGARVSDSEIVSYLLFGAPSVQVFAGRRGRQDQTLFERSAQQLADVLSGTLERSLTGSLGVPVDHLRIDPGDVDEGFSGAEIEIGKQIDVFGQPAFLTASPRLCPGRSLLISRTTGASLETWLADEWLMAVSLDPVRGCEAAKLGTSGYSVGLDVFWEKH
jgi:autotransporter translocation and assembly factor TamB